MGRKKVIAVEKVKRTEYGYMAVEPKTPREAPPPQGTVPVKQYAKREEGKKPGFFSRFRKKRPKTSIETGAAELERAADILEGR